MKEEYDVIVIGGGASGMMAAGRAADRGKRVLLLERNTRLGEKLRISGGGRCNIFNAEPDVRKLLKHYGAAEPFLYSAFATFGVKETKAFFESLELPTVVETRQRAFPVSQKAADVVGALERCLESGGVEIRTGTRIRTLESSEGKVARVVAGQKAYSAGTYILATGGRSHPETGSTGDGFGWLRALGHTVSDPTPTIVPLKVREKWVRDVSGVTAKACRITFTIDGKRRLARKGDVLFTHFGISGPTVLNAASAVADLLQEGPVEAHIDLFPGEDLGPLDQRITTHFDAHKNKLLRNVFKDLVPGGMADALLSRASGIDPEKKVHSVLREERRALAALLKDVLLTIDGLMGFDRAVVADGGVALAEVDTRTMRSKKAENLLITGDLLNIRRPSGGYSLQLCWTTGFLAGENA